MFWSIVLYVFVALVGSVVISAIMATLALPDTDDAILCFIFFLVLLLGASTAMGISLLHQHAATVVKAIGG